MNQNIRIAKELVRLAKMIAAAQNTVEEEQVEGVAYCPDEDCTMNVTATFNVEYDENGEFVRVGDFLYAYDEDGNEVEIDSDSIDDLASTLKQSAI